MRNIFDRRGQVTIFIIVAIIVVAIIFLIIFLSRGEPEGPGGTQSNSQTFLSICLKDRISESIYLIETQGGYTNPFNQEHIDFKFENESESTIAYLCYYQGDYLPCVNQEPVLVEHLKSEIKNYISQNVEFCFDDLATTLGDEGYVVEVRYREGDFDIVLQEGRISVSVNAELVLTKDEESFTEGGFVINTPGKLYDMAIVSQRIINDEVLNCGFDISEYAQLYPEYKIEKTGAPNSVDIYTINHKDSPEIFRFAVRGCVVPPGY